MGRAKTTGPTALCGSRRAKQTLVVMLEALAGERGTSEAAERLGISLSRYYQLETRGLQGMLRALEPRPKGRQRSERAERDALRAEKKELEKELRRQRSLLRAAQRSVGLSVARPAKTPGGRKGKRGHRGATVRQTLRVEAPGGSGEADGSTQPDGAAGGASRGE